MNMQEREAFLSPFVRREWIEILRRLAGHTHHIVSLREKGVD